MGRRPKNDFEIKVRCFGWNEQTQTPTEEVDTNYIKEAVENWRAELIEQRINELECSIAQKRRILVAAFGDEFDAVIAK